MKPHHQKLRLRKLIKPGIQLRLIATSVGIAAIGMMLQAMQFNAQLSELAATSPPAVADVLVERVALINLNSLLTALLVSLPLAGVLGVLATFRVAGPIYRFERHLADVVRNEDTGPCRLRKGDELQELCAQINEAVDALRSEANRPAQQPHLPAERAA